MRTSILILMAALAIVAVGCGGGAQMNGTQDFQSGGHQVAVGGSEVIFLAEMPSSTTDTKIMQVFVDDGTSSATLIQYGTLTGIPYGHIAITNDGNYIFAVSNGTGTNGHLARFDMNTKTTVDLGDYGLDNATQLAFAPNGKLYAARQGANTLNEIVLTGDPPVVDTVTNLGYMYWGAGGGDYIRIGGADLVFTSDSTMYLMTNSGNAGLFSVDISGMPTNSIIATKEGYYGSFTGLASRFNGTGALIGSHSDSTKFELINTGDWSSVQYDMLDENGDTYHHHFGDMTSLPAPISECEPYVTDLILGQNTDIGSVTVWTEDGDLHVQYDIDDSDWCLVATHLDVECALEDIPQTKNGNPIPGQFEFSGTHECDTSVEYGVNENINPDCEDWCEADTIYIAAHAKFRSSEPIGTDENGDPIYAWATAWGFGPEFDGNQWGTYIEWTPCCD